LGAVLLASCDPEAPSPVVAAEGTYEACPDAQCRHELLVAAWPDDREGVTARVGALQDPVEQVAVISVLTETWPGTTAELCTVLEDRTAELRCRRTNNRPHLWTTVPSDQRGDTTLRRVKAEEIPTIIKLVQSAGLTAELPELETTPAVRACDGLGEATCLRGAAENAAREGQVSAVVALCGAVDEERWRDECHFQAAETLLAPGRRLGLRPEHAEDSTRLCLAAGRTQGHCISHLSAEIARYSPSADATDASGWAATARSIDAVVAHIGTQDPGLAERVEERLWTEALWFTISRADDPIGSGLDHVPETWHYAWRAALGAWVVRNAEPAGLEEAADEVARRAGRRDGVAETLVSMDVRPRPPALWVSLLPGEAELPRTFFAFETQRARGEDPAEDLTIALLEAAGHEEPIAYHLLAEGLGHPSARVRWTAVRVLVHVDSEGRVPRPERDPDPLVMGRLAPR